MTEIYEDGTYLANNPSWHEQDSPWKASQIVKLMERNSLEPQTVCEVGCGAGEILNRLHGRASEASYCGYDISPHAIQLCKTKEKPNLEFFEEDLLEKELEIPFDVVLAIDVFEHVEDYFGFLRRLRPKGKYKIFHIPLDLSVQSVLRASPILGARHAVGHIHYFTKETALETLKDTGYEVIDHFYTSGALELPNRGWRANLLRLPRKLLYTMHRDLSVRLLGGFSLLVLAK